MLDLPEDVWRNIALNLSAPDVLSFISVNKNIHKSLGQQEAFWKLLLARDASSTSDQLAAGGSARQAYMIQAYMYHLPSVKWHPLRRTAMSGISPREGHLACAFKGPNEQRICVTGGFTDDQAIYVLHVPKTEGLEDGTSWTWGRLTPHGQRTAFVYGASLTALEDGDTSNTSCHVARAVRFGGFQGGGYSQETNQVAVLTLKDEGNQLSAVWEVVLTQNSQFAPPRAYHTATLVGGRYLVVIGGMMHRESILGEAILDTHTWSWLDRSVSCADEKPSGRHGHSVIFDTERNRFVMFGGGSGTDLLRSGHDNAEVWELKMGQGWQTNLVESLPWRWSKVHGDPSLESDEDEEHQNEDVADSHSESAANDQQYLSPAESLCLGRCHNGVKISRDSALLMFGSGRPSTNGVIAYDLRADRFVRPRIHGPLPKPRFTGVAAFLEAGGYLFVHGGYTSQDSESIGDMSILDLAPALNREFNGLPVDSNKRCCGVISDEEAQRGRHNSDAIMQRMLGVLTHAPEDERQNMAAQMLDQLISTGEMGGRTFMLMNMIANGAAILHGSDEVDESDEESDVDSDSDDQDSNDGEVSANL